MKPLLVLVFTVAPAVTALAQRSDAVFLIDTTLQIMQKRSINAEKVNWPRVREKAFIMAKDIESPTQLGPVIRYLYQSVDDYHGAFFYNDSTYRWTKEKRVVSDSIMNEWKKGVVSITKVFDVNIGYLRIPSIPIRTKEDYHTKAQALNDSLCSLLSKNVKGVILDVRLNGGGAMQPMILGLTNFLQPGTVGSFHGDGDQIWELDNTSFSVGGVDLSKITPRCSVDARSMPVVLLVGPGTGSSGEFMLIPFKTRPNTALLGSSTAGYTTAVTGMPLREIAYINLSVSYGADKNGKVYREAFKPDIEVKGADSFNDLKNDQKVQAAIHWIQKQTKQRVVR